MTSGRDFIVFSDNWSGPGQGLPTSAIHLFGRLARRNRVFWFNTISRLPRLTREDVGKVASTIGRWASGRGRPAFGVEPGRLGNGVHVSTPIMVPWFKPLARQLNRRLMERTYRCLRDMHGVDDPVVVTTAPYGVDLVQAVNDGTKVYYCVDEFLDYPGLNHRDMAAMELDLLGEVDGLVVTSRNLERKRPAGLPMLRLPHGVDFEHFHGAAARAEPEPRMEHFPRPVVGFFGVIGEWVDLGVICRLSEAFPDTSFVLLGRVDVGLGAMVGRPNVYLLGSVPYEELPRYARYFDVGLIPFVVNDLTRAVNPLKLMEYFALGLPVLSTRLPEIEEVRGPLRLALSEGEFRAGLAELLALTPRAGAGAAFAVARENTWDARVKQLSVFLEELARGRLCRLSASEAVPCPL
jgi:glycosyltransferase involved in cell wall biosynthesis